MHELGLSQEIVDIVLERCGAARVRRIVVEVGQLAAVMPDALLFCFDLCTHGTRLEGAKLEIEEIPGRARCHDCRSEIVLTRPLGQCTCGCIALEWLAGTELNVREVEVV